MEARRIESKKIGGRKREGRSVMKWDEGPQRMLLLRGRKEGLTNLRGGGGTGSGMRAFCPPEDGIDAG